MPNIPQPCHKCGYVDPGRSWANPKCRNCRADPPDGSAPNVLKAIEERPFLDSRYEHARSSISQAGYEHRLDQLATLFTQTKAVVAMPLGWAVRLLTDPNLRHMPYGPLVDDGSMAPAAPADDIERTVVDYYFYGRHGAMVVHGALSLDGLGACSFGNAHLTLDDLAIADRATVTEDDSFKMADRHVRGPQRAMPPGYISTWAERHKLLATKYVDELARGDDLAAQPRWVIRGHAPREEESFFEVHIYDGFHRDSVSGAQIRVSTSQAKFDDPACDDAEELSIRSLRTAAGKLAVPFKETYV